MAATKVYPMDMSFVDREGRKVNTSPTAKPGGKAYGFFDCNASKGEIEGYLPFIREVTQTPSELELSLTEGLGGLEGDPLLMPAYESAKSRIRFPSAMSTQDRLMTKQEIGDRELRYTIQVTVPDKTNERAAEELDAILNNMYNLHLYQENDPFRGAIVFEENGKYVLRD